jgi:hypothetical protein
MRFVKGYYPGRICASDEGIRLEEVTWPGGRRRGWNVAVERPPSRRIFRHFARTLKEARAWARQHWRPRFLVYLVADLPSGHHAHALLKEAALGDEVAFLALLDAVEEAGKEIDRWELELRAMREGLFA